MIAGVKCPRCSTTTDARAPACSGCGVDLLQAFEGRAWQSEVDRAAALKSGRRPAKSRARRALALSAALAAAFGAATAARVWMALPTQGRVLPPDARRAAGCAFVLPRGWHEEPPPSGPWTGLARVTDGVSAIDVLSAPASLVEQARTGPGATAAAASAFNGAEPRVEFEGALVVDGIEALRLRVSGGRAYLPSAEEGRSRGGSLPAPRLESQALRGELVLVPAASATLVIRAVAGEAAAPALSRALAAFYDGFRVLARPAALRSL
jgi:hypothetical protein